MAGTQMLQRRDTAAGWTANNRVLGAGEVGWESDTRKVKFGNGTTPWNALPYINYLPLDGKAADAEKLDGFDSSEFVLGTDATTAATASKVARRTSDGRLKAATATEDDDLATFLQLKDAGRYLGSGNTFPTANLRLGDKFHHSVWQALTVYAGASIGWRQLHPSSMTAATRTALPTTGLQQIYSGFEVDESDTGRVWRYRGTKWDLSGGKTPHCMVTRTSTLNSAVQNSWTGLPFQQTTAESTETSMWASANPTRLVAPVTALYLASIAIGFFPIQSGQASRYVGIRKNGQDGSIRRMNAQTDSNPLLHEYGGTAPFSLVAGDYIELVYYTTAAGDTINYYSSEISPRLELTHIGRS